jgi:hypothetical protein
MLELIAAGILGIASHQGTKDFVRRRLRYTDLIEKPGIGLFAGAAATVAAAPVVAVLPLVGATTAVLFGTGVGTGVAFGARQARKGYLPPE